MLMCFSSVNTFKYWESIPKEKQINLLQSGKISKDAYSLYKGDLIIKDNGQSNTLLDSLSLLPADTEMKALYFYLFNQVCQKSDGASNEILGKYCQKIILSDIEYVLYYLKNNQDLLKQYIQLLGTEFYFKEDGASEMQYNFDDFKEIINEKLNCKKEYEAFLLTFYKDIQFIMNGM